MTKQEFLSRLERLLEDLSPEDREDALRFYQEYFEDAGEENEQAALEDLGDVQELAQQIRDACPAPEKEPAPRKEEQHRWPAPSMRYNRPNFEQEQQPNLNTEQAYEKQENDFAQPKQEQSNLATMIVIGLILFFTAPVWLGIFGGLFGIVVVGALVFITCLISAVVVLFNGAGVGSIMVAGITLIIGGIGLMISAGSMWAVSCVCIPLFKFAVRFLKNLFKSA